MKKARRLNNHVFSMLKARCPLEDKQACAIKQSGAPLHRIKFDNTVSAFETLPQKGAWAVSDDQVQVVVLLILYMSCFLMSFMNFWYSYFLSVNVMWHYLGLRQSYEVTKWKSENWIHLLGPNGYWFTQFEAQLLSTWQ